MEQEEVGTADLRLKWPWADILVTWHGEEAMQECEQEQEQEQEVLDHHQNTHRIQTWLGWEETEPCP